LDRFPQSLHIHLHCLSVFLGAGHVMTIVRPGAPLAKAKKPEPSVMLHEVVHAPVFVNCDKGSQVNQDHIFKAILGPENLCGKGRGEISSSRNSFCVVAHLLKLIDDPSTFETNKQTNKTKIFCSGHRLVLRMCKLKLTQPQAVQRSPGFAARTHDPIVVNMKNQRLLLPLPEKKKKKGRWNFLCRQKKKKKKRERRI